MRRYADRDALDAIAANARDARRLEREHAETMLPARATDAEGPAIYYCRGKGCPVVILRSVEEWERRDTIALH